MPEHNDDSFREKTLEDGDFSCPTFHQMILSLDLYYKPFSFLMPDHRDRYRSHFGAFLSIVTFFIVIVYASYKLNEMYVNTSFQVEEVEQEEVFASNATFTTADGFYVAAAITEYDRDPNPIEDPEVGTLKMYLKKWDVYDEENGGVTFEEVVLRPCQESDFDLGGGAPNSLFYDTNPSSMQDLVNHWRKLKCIQDPQQLTLFGNYDTEQAANLMIVFELCNPKLRKCKTEDQIREWLQRKYIVTLQNNKRFVQHEFDDKRIAMHADMRYLPVSSHLKTDIVR